MKPITVGLLLAMAGLCSSNAKAEMTSANTLLPYCKHFLTDEIRGGYNAGFFVGLCAGILDGVSYLSGSLPTDRRSCKPKGVTQGQLMQVFVAYLEARPQRQHEDVKDLAIDAFREAWPCPK